MRDADREPCNPLTRGGTIASCHPDGLATADLPVTPWPPITEPLLLERLQMTSDEFDAFLKTMAKALPAREYDAALHERALGYPWDRPESSYFLKGYDVEGLADMEDARREALLARFAIAVGERDRFPLLAYGSNGAPDTLAAKFAHFPEEDRDVLVLAGTLHDFDVGAAAHPTAYGAMPATLFPSPGTAMRCAVLWVNATQFTQLAWSEISYLLGRLEGVRFLADDAHAEIDTVFGFVSRFGTFCPRGGPVALSAVPAENRTAPQMSQPELLDAAADIALGTGSTSEDLVRQLFPDLHAFIETCGAR